MANRSRTNDDGQDPLLIDSAAAAERPLAEDIRLWVGTSGGSSRA
jgi:hypothetical protein